MADFSYIEFEDIDNIYSDIAKIFKGETEKKLQDEIRKLIIIANDVNVKLKSGNYKSEDMKKAYYFIMELREFLTGEIISYNVYIRGENINDVKVINLSTQQILAMVDKSGNVLKLRKFSKKILEAEGDAKIDVLIQKHLNSVTRSLKPISKNYVVPFNNVKDVVSSRVGNEMYWQDINGKKGKSAYTPKIFNRGWIYEAFEATIDDVYKNVKSENYTVPEKKFRSVYFNEKLKYDNVKGFKAGDVKDKQIKTNAAQLMANSTLKSYLDSIIKILEGLNKENYEELSQKLKELFTYKDTVTDKINNELDKKINLLLDKIKL